MKVYIDKIKTLIENFDDTTLKALDEISCSKTYIKGDFLLEAESICNKSYWVEYGILRKYYVHNDKEVTTEFYFKDVPYLLTVILYKSRAGNTYKH
jgi:hypothetical protein